MIFKPFQNTMSNSLYENKNFYTAIAYLFYAIAIADKTITREEKLKIIAYVKKYWSKNLPVGNSEALIYQTLRELITKNTEGQKAFLEFSEHYNRNRKLYDISLKTQLIAACDAIATKKGKRSKMELILLTKLHTMFYPKEG